VKESKDFSESATYAVGNRRFFLSRIDFKNLLVVQCVVKQIDNNVVYFCRCQNTNMVWEK